MYIQITIGRNASPAAWAWLNKSYELPQEKWDAFVAVASMTLNDALLDNKWSKLEKHFGTGEWEGVEEESCHISAYHPHPLWLRRLNPFWARNMRSLKRNLAHVAFKYGQEAIAVTVGNSELVEAK